MGRGATNQKGPQAAFLAALHAIRGAGKKMPVNLVLVAEGEEEVGSPNFPQDRARRRASAPALEKSHRHLHAEPRAGTRRQRPRSRSAPRATSKCDLVATGEAWGRGSATRRPLEPRGATRPAGLAPGAGAQHARDTRRAIPPSTVSSSTCARSAPKSARCSIRSPSGSTRRRVKEAMGIKVWARNAELAPGARGLRLAARRSRSKGSSAATPAPAARPSCRPR